MSDDARLAEVSSLLKVLDRFAGLRIWVVGDLMLDEYVMGAVERISPEAPVPVVRVRDTEHRLVWRGERRAARWRHSGRKSLSPG